MSRPRSTNRLRVSTVCRAALLTVAAGMVWVFALVFVGSIVVEFFQQPQTEYVQHQFLFRKDGLPVWKTRSVRHGEDVMTEYHDLNGKPVEMEEKEESHRAVVFVDSRIWKRPQRATWRSEVVRLDSRVNEACYFEELGTRGQFTLFELPSKQRVGWIGQQGFSKTPLSEGQQFPTQSGTDRAGLVGIGNDGARSLGWITSSYYQMTDQRTGKVLIEPGGRRVYWIDLRDRSSRLVWDGEPVWAASFEGPDDTQTKQMRVVVRTEDALRVISLGEAALPGELPAASAVPLTGTPTVVETLRLPESVHRAALLQWERTSEGPLFVEPLFTNGWKLTWATPEGIVLRERIVSHRDISPGGEEQGAWMTPLIQIPVFGDFMMWATTHPEDSESSSLDHRRARQLDLELACESPGVEWKKIALPVLALHVSVALWSWLAMRRLRRFGSSIGEQLFWGGWMLAFGVPGYLAFRVHRTWGPVDDRRIELSAVPRPLGSGHGATGAATPQTRPLPNGRGTVLGHAIVAVEDRGLTLLARVGLSPGHAALVLKELRSTAIIGAAACLAYLLVVASLTNATGFGWMGNFVPNHGTPIPFLDGVFLRPFSVISLLLAICLAVWQTLSESRGVWLFLLYCPVSRRAIVLSKLMVGLSVVLICSALPIIAYGAWAARPGTHPSPFEWSMTHETWRLWWSMSPLYLGTLLTMLRPARWFGTRLLSCVAGFGWMVYREPLGAWLWPMWQEFAVVALIDLVFAACLLLIAREREYS